MFISRISKDLYPRAEITTTSEQIENELNESRYAIHDLLLMLDHQSVHQYYEKAVKGLCDGALFGLTLMTVAGFATAFLLTLLVCVDAHTWIYLHKKWVILISGVKPIKFAFKIGKGSVVNHFLCGLGEPPFSVI